MANYETLKAAIQDVVKTNGNNEITGALLQQSLLAMINSLGGYQYMGVATPTTNPGTPDQNVFYIASENGAYSNFGGMSVSDGEVAILKYNGTWTKEVTGAATAAQVTQLGQKVDEFAQGKFYGYFGDASELPAGNIPGFAYVGEQPPFAIYNYDGNTWADSGLTVNGIPVGNGEDIDYNADGLLQFADRTYDAQDPNGMGYVILRKNKTFAEQVTQENTIYEIRYDFDLGGASVTIPAGCVLKFAGGQLTNGTILGTSTRIVAPCVQIFNNITLSWGSFLNNFAPAEWFASLQDAVDNYPNIVLTKQQYSITETLKLYATSKIDGNNACITFQKTANSQTYATPVDDNVSDSVFDEDYAVSMGFRSIIRNVTIKLASANLNGVLINPDYVVDSFYVNRFSAELSALEPSIALPFLDRVIIENYRYQENDEYVPHGTAIGVVKIDSFVRTAGMWGHIAHDVKIVGSWYYGIVIDNGKHFDSSNVPFWITSSCFDNIYIYHAKIGIYIGQSNKYTNNRFHPGGIRFNNVMFQSNANYGTERLAILQNCSKINFNTCFALDWDSNGVNAQRPFLVNPNLSTDILIENSLTAAHRSTKIFDISTTPTETSGLQLAVKDTREFILTDFIPVTTSSTDLPLLLSILPSGHYAVDVNLATLLGVSLSNGGKYILEVIVGNTERMLILRNSFYSSTKKGSFPYVQLAVVLNRNPAFSNYYWKACANEIVRKSLSDAVSNSWNFFVSSDQTNFTLIGSGSRTIARGHLFPISTNDIKFKGATTERPTMNDFASQIGFMFFDETLGKPVWYKGGGVWVDATGASV